MATKLYPLWKKIAWRYARVFLSAFLATFGVNFAVFGDADVLRSTIISAIAAGLSALAKALRENQSYDELVHKLPL